MKKTIRFLIVTAMCFLSMLGLAAQCSLSQAQSDHSCAYSQFTATSLGALTNTATHDFVLTAPTWSADREEKTVFAYKMVYSCNYSGTITLGKNVYVGICTHSAELNLSNATINLSKDENGNANSGLFVYDCAKHGCYNELELLQSISGNYLTFAYHHATAKGATAYTLPAGKYGMNGAFSLTEFVINGMVIPADPANTTICFNNFANESYNDEITALRNAGVTVHTVCKEDVKDNSTHTCTYFPDATMSEPINKAIFYEMVSQIEYFPVDTENPVNNFLFGHLTENICYDEALTIPQGLTIAICKNGFNLDVKATEGLYVFDCTPHACLCTGYEETIPLWKDGVTALTSYMSALHQAFPTQYPETLTLTEGNYALMEDFAEGTFPIHFECSENVTFCLNGHSIAGMEEKFTNTDYAWDCTVASAEELNLHVCDKLSPQITAIDLATYLAILEEEPETLAYIDEIAVALTEDVVLGEPLIIPRGKTIHICLNGHSITANDYLLDQTLPSLFIVEYTATLHITDCSETQSGIITAYTPSDEIDTIAEEEFKVLGCTIVNLGTCIIDGGTYEGTYAIQNHGSLSVKNATITGIFAGIYTIEANAESYPLHAKKLSTYVYNCNVSGLSTAIFSGGALDIAHSTLYASQAGIINAPISEDLQSTGQIMPASIEDVTINLTLDIVEQYFDTDIVENVKSTLPYVGGMIAMGDINLYGDLQITVDNQLLEPIVNSEGNLTYIPLFDLALISSQCVLHGNTELTDNYIIYLLDSSENGTVIANKDLSEHFILMEGMAGIMNESGEYVAVPADDLAFTKNARLESYTLNVEGYVRLEFFFRFDEYEDAPSFLENEDAKVKVIIADEPIFVNASDMELQENGTYLYSVDLYAMDYRNNISVQFTNGEYIWTGATNVSIETFLLQYLAKVEYELDVVISDLNNAEIEGNTDTIVALQEEKLQLTGYKNVLLSMLNYYDAAAVHFGVKDAYMARQSTFSAIRPISDENVEMEEPIQPEEDTDLSAAMEKVTADDLVAYKATLEAGSKLPSGIKLIGMTLLLDSGTDIRVYLQIANSVNLDNVQFTINGEETTLHHYDGATYYLAVDNLNPFQLKNMYTFAITTDSTSYSFQYGACSYLYNTLKNEASTDKLVHLAKAMWLYCEQMEKAYNAIFGAPYEEETEITEGENNGEVGDSNENV